MTRPTAIGLWALATILLAGATATLVTRNLPRTAPAPATSGSEHDFHAWMHEQLEITPDQHEALAPYEADFESERVELRAEITKAGRDLAAAVRAGRPGSPEIESALSRLNAAQAELQRATLDHFFAMKEHLAPDQAEKLLQWTHDSIGPE